MEKSACTAYFFNYFRAFVFRKGIEVIQTFYFYILLLC